VKLTLPAALGLLFIGLRLTGYIDWSWWLVLLPLYGPFALALILFLAVVPFGGWGWYARVSRQKALEQTYVYGRRAW
jgi:hypothetical protein